jgi:prephenate dehydratase
MPPRTSPTRFAYLGPEGTFAEAALISAVASSEGARYPQPSVPAALAAVRSGDADAALVPLENSVEGSVPATMDGLADGDPLVITREVVLPVQFVLGARAATPLAAIRTVAAHPQASAQCRHWLREHIPAAVVVEALSNGSAAQSAMTGESDAAVCAPLGAIRERLVVLAKDIADHPDAMTRFALVSRPGPPPAPTGHDLTTLAVYIAHDRVGALLAVLTELAVRGVNLTRIESRPTGERLGRYVFFLDCSGHVAEARMGEALQGLRRVCADVRFLGSYPRAGGSEQSPFAPVGTSDTDFADAAAWLARIRSGT